jgi:putative flippase GtrA
VRFVSIGAVSTVVFATIFLMLHGPVGAVAADVIALGVCTVINTAANRRLTFNLRGRTRRVRQQLRGLAAALLPLGLNLVALACASALGITEAVPLVLVLTLANAVASMAKFVLLQHWVFVVRRPVRKVSHRSASPAVR